jgi:hypothetical protein
MIFVREKCITISLKVNSYQSVHLVCAWLQFQGCKSVGSMGRRNNWAAHSHFDDYLYILINYNVQN